jgi:hypothetical protein
LSTRIGDLTDGSRRRSAEHREERARSAHHFRSNLGREVIEDVVADERIEHRVAVVGAAEVRVAVVDLEVPDSRVVYFMMLLSRALSIGGLVDEDVAVLHHDSWWWRAER